MQGRGVIAASSSVVFEGEGPGLAPRTDATLVHFDGNRAEQVDAGNDRDDQSDGRARARCDRRLDVEIARRELIADARHFPLGRFPDRLNEVVFGGLNASARNRLGQAVGGLEDSGRFRADQPVGADIDEPDGAVLIDQNDGGLREFDGAGAGQLVDPAGRGRFARHFALREGDPEPAAEQIAAIGGDRKAERMPIADLANPVSGKCG